MTPIIAPSLLSSDFANLEKTIKMLNKSQADWIHLDIMDGHFVPNLTFGMPIISAIKRVAQKPLDVHLMIEKPERYLEDFKNSGADCLSVHWEVCPHLHRTINKIKELDMLSGVAINPHTPVNFLENIINDVDFVVVMSVNPGFGGQRFILNSITRVKELRKLIDKHNSEAMIEIDGGVDMGNAPLLIKAGADILVAGNTVFGAESPIEMIKSLKNIKH